MNAKPLSHSATQPLIPPLSHNTMPQRVGSRDRRSGGLDAYLDAVYEYSDVTLPLEEPSLFGRVRKQFRQLGQRLAGTAE